MLKTIGAGFKLGNGFLPLMQAKPVVGHGIVIFLGNISFKYEYLHEVGANIQTSIL